MVDHFSNSNVLLHYCREQRLFPKLVKQLQKDFLLANVAFEINVHVSCDVLKALLHEKIYLLLMEHFDSYLNLLYIIDIPERAFKKVEGTDAVEVSQQISFLILKRELQKIMLKEKYSS